MLETFNARIASTTGLAPEDTPCPCALFPEVSHVPEIRDVIDSAIAALVESLAEFNVDAARYLIDIGGEAAVGHSLTVAAAAGYALALDTVSDPENTFDVADVDWTTVPDIDPMGDN